MRPPIVQLAIAYGAGLWVGLVLSASVPVAAAAAGVALLLGTRTQWPGLLCAAVSLGLLGGALAGARQRGECVRRWTPGPHAALARMDDEPGPRGLTSATILFARERCGGRVPVRADPGSLPAGARVILVGTFRAPSILLVTHARVLSGPRSLRYRLRAALSARIAKLYGARAPMVDALMLGRRGGLDPGLRRAFAGAGLSHLLAISGLHVGIIALWVSLVLRRLAGRRPAIVLGPVVVWMYVGLLGFPAPAVRAAGFVTLRAWALVRQRHPPTSAVLAVAALLVLSVDPDSVGQVGAWLSVTATWGVDWALRTVPRGWRNHPTGALIAASAGATLATAPITGFAFGAVAPIGLAANVFAIPLISVAVPGLLASLALGPVLARGAGLVLAAVERCAFWASALPGGQIRGEPGLGFAAVWLAVLVMVVWLSASDHRRRLRRACALAAAAAWIAVATTRLGAGVPSGELIIAFLDVGQGDGIVIRTPHGHWLVLDAGPRGAAGNAGRRVVVPFLRRHAVQRVDVVIASHGDADHLGGIPAVLSAFDVGLAVDPGQPLGTPLYQEYLRDIDRDGTPWRAARAGDTISVDSVTLAVLHPTAAWLAHRVEPNENSVVVRLTYGEFDALLTGDAGLPVESLLVGTVPPVELLKVGHHGSAGSTGDGWLDRLHPTAAVISVGQNHFGHPSPVVLRRLDARAIPVFRTDRGGTVTIRSNGRYFGVTQGGHATFVERLRCRVPRWLRSSGSSSSRSDCIPQRRVSFPTYSTTSPSPQKSSPPM